MKRVFNVRRAEDSRFFLFIYVYINKERSYDLETKTVNNNSWAAAAKKSNKLKQIINKRPGRLNWADMELLRQSVARVWLSFVDIDSEPKRGNSEGLGVGGSEWPLDGQPDKDFSHA